MEILRPISFLLLGAIGLSSCVWKPSYDRQSFLADSLRYELAREKKQRIELQQYEEELYYRYVEKSIQKENQGIRPRKQVDEGLDLPPVNTLPPTSHVNTPQGPSRGEEVESKPPTEDTELRDLNEMIAFPNMRVRPSGNSKIIDIPQGAFFAPGSTELTDKAKEYLAVFAKEMAGREDYVIDIEGHTDNTEESKEEGIMDRWDLSAIRATRVLRELVKQGVSPHRVIASGRGQFKPRVPNEPASNKIKNRRIEIRITPLRPSP